MATSSEPIEVESTIIDTDVAALSASEEWLAQINERAAKFAEQFKPRDVTSDQDYKRSKKARADANAEIKAIDQERKNMTAAIKRAVREFEGGAKLAIEPLTQIVDQYDEKNQAYERKWRADREAGLAQEYEDMAPFLVPLVPFPKIMAKYGNQKGKGWLNRTTNIEAAKDMLAEAVEQVAQAEKTIDSMVEETYREGAKARYFKTLDLQATLNEEAEAKDQRERVARLEQERAEREREERERMAAEEAARRQAEEDAWLERSMAEPVEPGHVRIVQPPSYATEGVILDNLDGTEPLVPEPTRITAAPTVTEVPIAPVEPPAPVTAPDQMGRRAGQAPMAPAPTEVPHPWVISIPSATKTQAQAVAGFMKASGIAFERIYSGDLSHAYEKWRGEHA